MRTFLAILAFTAAGVAAPAVAVTLTFDNVAGGTSLPNGYQGYNWNNFSVQDVRTLSVPSGYANDLISPHNIVFNGFGVAATLSSATRFSLTSGYFAAAWNNGLTVTIVGTLASAAVFAQSFVVNTTGPSFVMLNHATVDSVVFSSFGGTRVLLGRGTQFALDNLTLNEAAAIPEPAAWAMLVIGFGLIGAERRLVRRRSAPPRRQIIPGAPIACCRSAAVLSTEG